MPNVLGFDFKTGQMYTDPDQFAAMNAQTEANNAALRQKNANSMKWHNRLVNIGKVASAVPLAFAAAPAFAGMGAAGAGSAAAAQGAGAATAAGGGMTFGNLLQLGQLGAGLGSQIFGMRSQGRQNAQDSMARQRELDQQMGFARETEASRKAEFLAQQAALEKQWAADQQFKQDQWRASEEERLYARNQNDYTRQLLEQKEARKAQNRLRLDDLIRLGR